MKSNNISIELFRVSSDSKNLDMIFNCPDGCHFTSLTLEVMYINELSDFTSVNYDLSPALFGDTEQEEPKTRFVVSLPLDKLGISVPAIYVGYFKAEDSEYNELTDKAICSDVNYVYRCMLDELFMKEGTCDDLIPDEVIRKYLILYGHQAALAVEDFDAAKTYFRLMNNCFHKCGKPDRGIGSCCKGNCADKLPQMRPPIHSCNCGR